MTINIKDALKILRSHQADLESYEIETSTSTHTGTTNPNAIRPFINEDNLRIIIITLTTLDKENEAKKSENIDLLEKLTDCRKLVSMLQEEILDLRSLSKGPGQ